MKAFIERLINNKKRLYKDDYGEMLGDYNRELETMKGYNGRQLLELLQNCDDEDSKEVLISLDTDKKTISISNNGTPFSEKGYRSLFIANLSSKRNKRQYIGNKGLGFRSVISWSTAIEIQSNSLSLMYSEENRLSRFDQLFSVDEQQKIKVEEKLGKSIIPMPFLCMPQVNDIKQKGYVTTIIIHYKDDALKSILEQVQKITPETILFLKSINHIKFKGFQNKEDIICTKDYLNSEGGFAPKQKVKFSDSVWQIFEEEQDLPEDVSDSNTEEKEFYQIKIAVEQNFKKSSSYLFSFFPTNIQLRQPYILHATFDLDATRNQINNSEKNKFILNKVVDFTIKVAKYYAGEDVSYRPLEILNHKHVADTLDNLGYYDLIHKAKRAEEVFPCIDNTYKKLSDVIYVNDRFVNMLFQIKATDILDIHILPLRDRLLSNFGLGDSLDRSLSVLTDVVQTINTMAALELNIKDRALFISEIVKNCEFIKDKFPNQINFLIDDQDVIIPAEEHIYTPVTQNNSLKTPSFAHIRFLKRTLYDYLLDYLFFVGSDSIHKSRFIYEKLKGFCNIHSYEPVTLAQKIVSETANKIKEHPEKRHDYIREMNICLFSNFKLMEEETRKSGLRLNVPTITINGKVKTCEEVVLSSYYPGGKIAALVFEGIYTDENYVASPNGLGIPDEEDRHDVEAYLIWLGVNRFAQYKTVKNGLYHYFEYIKQYKGIVNSTGFDLNCKIIEGFDNIIKRISLVKLILWIYYDEVFKKQLNDINNADVVKNYYYTYSWITNKPSNLKYIVNTKFKYNFKSFLLEERYTWVNDFMVDYRAKEFLENGVAKSSINEILVLLGAKDDFNNISIDKVAEIINRLPKYYADGRKSQAFYKKALSHYRLNRKELKSPLKLFADGGNGLHIYPSNMVYFSDKIKLPKRLRQNFPVFNFPSRAGGTDAIKFFQINDLKSVQIHIDSYVPIKDTTEDLKSYLEKLKPLILTQRIGTIENPELQKAQALICSKIDIVLCAEIKYKVKGIRYTCSDYEFLHYKDYTYYIKIKEWDYLKSLRKNSVFVESVADIISLSFDVSGERNEFKNFIRNSYQEVLNNIKSDYGEDTYQEARELLGLADHKHAFWQAVLAAKGIEHIGHWDDLSIGTILQDELQVPNFNLQSINYENVNEETELIKINSLFQQLDLELSEFVNHYSYKISMEKLHLQKLKDAILSKKQLIKVCIWKQLSEKGIEDQALFLNKINKYEDYETFASTKAKELEHEFSIDTGEIVQQYIYSVYGRIQLSDHIDLEKIKRDNLSRFSREEQFQISQSERYKSLIYFPAALEHLRKEVAKIINTTVEEDTAPDQDPKTSQQILSSETLKKGIAKAAFNKKATVYTPRISNGRYLKEKGNTSERIVYDYLINNGYKNVDLISDDNEGLHYDIRYTDEKGVVKYVEAKTFDYGYFHLSKDQFEFGKKHLQDYEVWLVYDKQYIIPITDFFTNPKYEPIVNDYLVYLEIGFETAVDLNSLLTLPNGSNQN